MALTILQLLERTEVIRKQILASTSRDKYVAPDMTSAIPHDHPAISALSKLLDELLSNARPERYDPDGNLEPQ